MSVLKLPATLENLDQMIEFVLDGVRELGLGDKKSRKRLRLVCEEMLVNIINYAYPDSNGQVKISYDIDADDKKVVIRIVDKGVQFNPLEYQDPDLSFSIEEKDIGGLGIYLTKQLVDNIQYQREDEKNILTLVKIIKGSSEGDR